MDTDPLGTDRVAIMELKHAYCNHIDHNQPDELADLFTDDAFIGVSGRRGIDSYEGREEITEWSKQVPRATESLHLALCPTITITDSTATGHWKYAVFLLKGGEIELGLGEYEEEYRRNDGTWRIATRVANRLFTVNLGPTSNTT